MFLIHTIMECLSPKSTGFNEFSSNIATAVSKALPTAIDEPATHLRDDSQGEAFPTVSNLEARQDRENIIKTSALPYDSTPRVTSLDADEGTVSVPPVAEVSTIGVPTGSGLVPTVSAIFTTTSMVTPYSRRPREISAKDKARIHAEVELQMMIDGMDRSNEMIAKHLHEYEQAAAELTIGEKIELINELRYDIRGNQREFIPVCKQIEDFVPTASKEEGERFKRKGLRLEQGSAKKIKTSEKVSEEDLKDMMQLVPVEEV
nr:hypothetical protein [Tanacetum cinerariifolium]